MKVEASGSIHQEVSTASQDFNRQELRRCRLILRRLRFLETKNKQGNLADTNTNGGAAFSEWEAEALEWLLTEVGFLQERRDKE